MNRPYRVRFRTELINLDLTQDLKQNIAKLEKRCAFCFSNESITPINGVFQEEGEYIWFEKHLNFIPQIGLFIGDAFNELDWWETDITIVVSVQYFFKDDFFLVDLGWDIRNQLEVARRIEKLTRLAPN